VQLNFSRSIEPITPLDITITRMAVATEKEAKQQEGDNRTMGRKSIVPYALYRAEGYVSAHLADDTGFSDGDLQLLWDALINMFDHDHSAARGKMTARKLVVFKHDTPLGNAPAHKLFDLVQVSRNGDGAAPARAYADYCVTVNEAGTPEGVTLDDML
jgi:CRISPR-associated protein Csd2